VYGGKAYGQTDEYRKLVRIQSTTEIDET
jgi:hypothetical protein